MPRIVPSQVAQYIDNAFPDTLRHAEPLGATAGPLVAALVALLDKLPQELVDAIPAADYLRFVTAVELLRASVIRWGQPANAVAGIHRLGGTPALGGEHPLRLVRLVLEALPDEAPAANVPALAFLGQPDLAEVLRQDMSTAETALANGEYKAAAVMAGSVIEALLLWAVQRRHTLPDWQVALGRWNATRARLGLAAARALDDDPRRWGLEQFIAVAKELPVIGDDVAVAAQVAKDYRNLIHPGRAERLALRSSRGTATQAVGAMRMVEENLAERVAAGTL